MQGSRVVTYTDASAKDPAAVIDAKLRAEQNQIRVDLQATGSCSPIDPVYKELTTGTGGQLFFVQPGELPALAALTAPQVSSDFQPLLIANGILSGTPRVFTVPVDLSVGHVSFSIAAEAAVSVTVTRPDGTVVAAGNPGVTIQNFSTGALVGVDTPAPGAWTLSVSGTGEYSASVSGNTSLFVDEFYFADYSDLKHPGFYRIKGQPLSGLRPTTCTRRARRRLVRFNSKRRRPMRRF